MLENKMIGLYFLSCFIVLEVSKGILELLVDFV